MHLVMFIYIYIYIYALADAFIQSDLHCIQVTVFYILSALYVYVFMHLVCKMTECKCKM